MRSKTEGDALLHFFSAQAGVVIKDADNRDINVGKMSVGVRRMTIGLMSKINRANTRNVVGTLQCYIYDPHVLKLLLFK